MSSDPTHLFARMSLLDLRVRSVVEHRRQGDPNPDDPFRGLYLGDDDVDRLLDGRDSDPEPAPDAVAQVEAACDDAERFGRPSRLRAATRAFGLSPLDVELLLITLAPDLDARFERLYGYLNDDVTRRRACVGLALQLAGVSAMSATARARLSPTAPLPGHRIVSVEDADRPFLTRSLRVPDRVTSHLLGNDEPDPALTDLLVQHSEYRCALSHDLSRTLRDAAPLVYMRDQGRRTGSAVASAALHTGGHGVLGLDLERLAARADAEEVVRLAAREALLIGAGIVAGPLEPLVESSPGTLRRLAALPVAVVVIGDATWDPGWSPRVPLVVDAPPLDRSTRDRLWHEALGSDGGLIDDVPVHLHLGPEQIRRAVRSAALAADLSASPVGTPGLLAGARAQNAAGLERLARRLVPAVGWADLVLPESATAQLREIAIRARHRDQVLSEWRMRPGGGRGQGVTALFAGDSGTGKTMSAEVIAGELGLDLYKVDLATVVDKYIGETEKNLERIFAEAAGVNAVLLFDEADAVFGKRSDVRDAHDRYANIESAYLLQRMETFDGLAILATNIRSNIDDAFTRRLDCIVDFPLPTEEHRLTLWRQCLAPPLPCDDDLDLEFCAKAFELTGGNIRSIAITAAYQASATGRPVGMRELIAAVQQEYRKLGRLVLEREFGRYLSVPR